MAITKAKLSWQYALLIPICGGQVIAQAQVTADKPVSKLSAVGPSAEGVNAATVAQKVYDQIKAGDTKGAVVTAEQGLRRFPQNRNLSIAYTNALFADGRQSEADATVTALIGRLGIDDELLVLRESIRRQLAENFAYKAYDAYKAGDSNAAVLATKQAVVYAPDSMGYRLLLIDLLMKESRFPEADEAASAAIATDKDDMMPVILRGYTRQYLGQKAAAFADFATVLRNDELSASEQKHYRVIIADAALATGEAQFALDVLQPLSLRTTEKRDPLVLWRQRAAQAMLSDAGRTTATPSAVLRPLALDCHVSPYGRECNILPALALGDPAYLAAAAAYKSLSDKDEVAALSQARQAVRLDPDNADYQGLLLQILQMRGHFEEADGIATELIAKKPPTAALLAQRGEIRAKLGQKKLADSDFSAALKLDTLPLSEKLSLQSRLNRKAEARATLDKAVKAGERVTSTDLDLAYLSMSIGDDARALDAFAKSDKTSPLSSGVLQDASYAAIRESRDTQALGYLTRAADLIFTKPLELRSSDEIKSLQAIRSNIAQIDREWGANASLSYRGAASALGLNSASSAAANDSIQIGAEVYWRPLGYRNGKLFEVYARAFDTPYSRAGGVTGAASVVGSVGLRWKPLGDQNFVLSLGRLFPVGSQMNSDTLANVSYFNGFGGELQTESPSWWTQQYYAEAGRYFQHPQTYAVANAKVGRSYRLDGVSPDLVAFPHAVLAGEYSDAYAKRSAVGFGPGINLRYWYRQDAYHAHRSYFDFSLQFRAALGGDVQRAKGTFLTLLTSY